MPTTRVILDSILDSHRARGWRAEKEALFSPRRIDVLAIAPGAKEVIAFEIKVSRQDFRQELRDPDKRGAVIPYCTQFYFVVPFGMVEAHEVPIECGLLYSDKRGCITVIKAAPGKVDELTFESDQREFDEAYMLRAFCEWWREFDADISASDMAHIPAWMKPRYIRPLRFQFDVMEASAGIPGVTVDCPVDFDQVPF